MTIWPPKRNTLDRPVYRSLAQRLIDAIEAGDVADGTKLPPHRTLAFQLGVSVQTVSRAYDELSRLGVISGEVGRGSFVRMAPADAQMPWQRPERSDNVIDCSMLVPVTGQIQMEAMSETLSDMAQNLPPSAIFSFRPRATLESHCDSAATWLTRCGIEARSDHILPTNGNTSAMTIALMTCAMPGDMVATESVGHHTITALTSGLGLRLTGLAIDAEGIVPDDFERACRTEAVKVLFLLPNGLNPTAAMMGDRRRQELVEVARRHDVWIVENDAWGPLQSDRHDPIAALAPERTLYFTGLTKCVLPGLRIGWLVVPEHRVSAARTRHLITNWMATPLMAEIATRWLDDGTAEGLLHWQQEQLARRNSLAARLLERVPHSGTANGMHIWCPLPAAWREDAFVSHARHNGVAVAAGSNFATADAHTEPAVRICLGAGSEADITKGLAAVAHLAQSEPEPILLAI